MRIRAGRLLLIIIMFFIMLFILSGCFNMTVSERIVSSEKAQNALNEALSCLQSPYDWGGNGPDSFDCSGLVIWSYQQVIDKTLYYQTSTGLEHDIRMDDLFCYNVAPINPSDVRPGDIVFVTSKDGLITHGGLFIKWINADTFLYVNASATHGGVVINTRRLGEQSQGKWFMGFGQFIERTVIY